MFFLNIYLDNLESENKAIDSNLLADYFSSSS